MRRTPLAVLALLVLAGCVTPASDVESAVAIGDTAPSLAYKPVEPDMAMELVEEAFLLAGEGVDIYARVVRPAGEGPFPVIAQFTPYTAPGQNPLLDGLAEPVLANNAGNFDTQFVRRGYAFAYADVRGTGDSSGCLDLRGPKDVADIWHLTEWLGTQPWSNGKVGFIGASYPGSEAHIAAVAGNPHVAAVVPVVASTSFYHYHHNDGVPYAGNHALGGTNAGYTQNAVMATVNPQHPNYASRYAEEAQCPYFDNIFTHGGLDQTGAYYDWWQERNLRPLVDNVTVPVLMAQGLADWNVKPDHIARWFNDLDAPKTLIAGQWPHQYPEDANDAYGKWWEYVSSFFDTHLKGIDTGMFTTDVAWVQDTDKTWHRSASWPLLEAERESLTLHLQTGGKLADAPSPAAEEASWVACPRDRDTYGTPAGAASEVLAQCPDAAAMEVVFESAPLAQDMLLSGVPLLNLTVKSTASFTHLVAVLEVIGKDGEVRRENYGYLNPTYRHGIDAPEDVPTGEAYNVTIDFYPQEDALKAGETIRLVVRSHDDHNTIEAFDPGENAIVLGDGAQNALWLPLRPAALVGVRL